MIEVTLPHPPRILHPNSRPYWAALYRAKKKYRADCYYLTRAARIPQLGEGDIHITLIWHPKTKNVADEDGCIASFKAGFDGVSDALGVDDSRFRIHFDMSSPVKGGAIRMLIEQ